MEKKVTLNNKVYMNIVWKFVYRSSRQTYWEFVALEQIGYQNHTEQLSSNITPILNWNHSHLFLIVFIYLLK